MKQKMVTINEKDFDYIKNKIPNFSEFVRASISDHKMIFDQDVDEMTAIKNRLFDLSRQYGSEKQILEDKLYRIECGKEKMEGIRSNPEVIRSLEFLKSGKGNINAVAVSLSKTTGANITTTHLKQWMSEATTK